MSQTTPNESFFSRALSKETSATNPSFRVYYGVAAGSVPFRWESRPGTPKHPATDRQLPPLTPPPSYYYFSDKNANFIKSNKQSLFRALVPRIKRASLLRGRGRSSSNCSVSSESSSRGDEGGVSPNSTVICCYSVKGMKSALLSIVGSGSS